ncbi:hypothetical protein [Diaminobutyricibacter sp. McL0608]|uniref:hypothetical protein n=1 Tax=Leifsonia sp. McL0608 TaxID=3143537 RepID=UPI0031F2EBBC
MTASIVRETRGRQEWSRYGRELDCRAAIHEHQATLHQAAALIEFEDDEDTRAATTTAS